MLHINILTLFLNPRLLWIHYQGTMDCFTGMCMVLFSLLDVIDLTIDGIFYEKVNSNSNKFLSDKSANTYKAIIFAFVVLGALAAVINIGVFLFVFFRRRKFAWKENESGVPLQFLSFITWCEDIPQIIVCLLIAFTMKHYLSAEVQYTKAVFTVGKSLFHLAYFCLTQRKDEEFSSCSAEVSGNVLLLVCGFVLLAYLGSFQ